MQRVNEATDRYVHICDSALEITGVDKEKDKWLG